MEHATSPISIYHDLFDRDPSSADDLFISEIKNNIKISNLPLLNFNCHYEEIPDGHLVRVIGFVQDSLEHEYFMHRFDKISPLGEKISSTAKYQDFHKIGDYELDESSVKLSERFSFYIVPIPGMNFWIKSRISNNCNFINSSSTICGKRKLDKISENSASKLRKNFPLIEEEASNDHGVLARVYKGASDILISDLVEMVGILEHPRLAQLKDKDSVEFDQIYPTIQVIDYKKFSFSSILKSPEGFQAKSCREFLLNHFKKLTGDEVLSKYLLINMVDKPIVELEKAFATDFSSLNVFNTNVDQTKTLIKSLKYLFKSIFPQIVYVELNIKNLNEGSCLWPSRDSDSMRLKTGRLQLNTGCQVLIDETDLQEGKLETLGVYNLQAIHKVCTTHQIPINFQVYIQNFPCPLNCLIISNCQSLIKDINIIKWKVDKVETDIGEIDEQTMEALRDYIVQAKRSDLDYRLGDEFQEILNKNFVEWRQDKKTFVSPEEFSLMLSLLNSEVFDQKSGHFLIHKKAIFEFYRTWTQAEGKAEPCLEDWQMVIAMEQERKRRLTS